MHQTASHERLIDFLQFTIGYLESRVALIDQKASLMLAVVGGLFATLAFVTDGLPRGAPEGLVEWVTASSIAVAFAIMIPTLYFLLQTIRSGRFFFGTRGKAASPPKFSYFMWPR
jgi:hypothetical protein